MALSAADVAKKWSKNLSASTDSIRQGVLAVTQNPAEKAAQRADAYQNGVAQAVASGKYQRGLRRVTLQSWQDLMINKGLTRIASGATAATPKMQNFLEKFLPYEDQLKQKLQALPRGDLQTNIQRAIMAIEHNAAFQYNP